MKTALLVVNNARQIFNCQRSDFFGVAEDVENQLPTGVGYSPSDFFVVGTGHSLTVVVRNVIGGPG